MYTDLMRRAIEVCKQGIATGQSPFGAAIATRDGEVIAAAHNAVRSCCDSTAHAEVMAIRAACTALGTTCLEGYILATTCEPCPMCAAAIHWARLDAVVYGARIADASEAGFHELSASIEMLYRVGGSPVRIHDAVLQDECRALFRLWSKGPNPVPY